MPYKDPEKQRAAQLRYRKANRSRYYKHREAVRRFVQEHKEAHGCMDCGIKYPYYMLDLDHREGEDKVLGLSKMANHFGLKRVKAEIEKCDVVCANCHRIRTHERVSCGTAGGSPKPAV